MRYWKRFVTIALAACLLLSCMPAKAETAGTAYASTQTVEVDGKKVRFQMYALKDANGNPTNYIKVRDLAWVLNGTAAQFNVDWDGAVDLIPGEAYAANGSEMVTPYTGNRSYIVPAGGTKVNGAGVEMDAIMLFDDAGGGYTYYKLRDLGGALGFTVDWSAERGVYIETGGPRWLLASETFYEADGSVSGEREHQYDARGNKIKEECRYYNSGGSYCIEYTYDESNRLVKSKSPVTTYTYNEKGHISEAIDHNSSDGRATSVTRYEYNDDGLVVRTTLDSLSNSGSWISGEWTYDEAGNCLSEIHYNGDGSINHAYRYEYDARGNMIKSVFLPMESVLYQTDYVYNEAGRMTGSVWQDVDGNLLETMEYEYDANGNIVKSVRYDPEGAVCGWNEYSYISLGN